MRKRNQCERRSTGSVQNTTILQYYLSATDNHRYLVHIELDFVVVYEFGFDVIDYELLEHSHPKLLKVLPLSQEAAATYVYL
jgi:hypothetical protein